MASGQCPSSVYQRVSGEVKTHSVRSEKASAAMNELRGSTRSFLERETSDMRSVSRLGWGN